MYDSSWCCCRRRRRHLYSISTHRSKSSRSRVYVQDRDARHKPCCSRNETSCLSRRLYTTAVHAHNLTMNGARTATPFPEKRDKLTSIKPFVVRAGPTQARTNKTLLRIGEMVNEVDDKYFSKYLSAGTTLDYKDTLAAAASTIEEVVTKGVEAVGAGERHMVVYFPAWYVGRFGSQERGDG